MNKYRRYFGIIIIVAAILIAIFASYSLIQPALERKNSSTEQLESIEQQLKKKQDEVKNIQDKSKKIKTENISVSKKIYSPDFAETGDDANDALFFTLYNDALEMIHSNSIKIKSMDWNYNPAKDPFVENGKDTYFVCELNMELISNYVQLGSLFENILHYPYYIKISSVEVKPYNKDKSILITNLSLMLYSKTAPDEQN